MMTDDTQPEAPADRAPSVVDGRSVAARMLGASMVGVGALLQPKADPEAHWSEPHKVTLVTEAQQSAGPGPELDVSGVPAEPPATPPDPRRPPQV